MIEIEPLCVLDVFVHQTRQRMGVGKMLFNAMLKREGLSAAKLAYDRPSPKLLSFVAKHYQLKANTPQSNNFVVFRKYFEIVAPTFIALFFLMHTTRTQQWSSRRLIKL